MTIFYPDIKLFSKNTYIYTLTTPPVQAMSSIKICGCFIPFLILSVFLVQGCKDEDVIVPAPPPSAPVFEVKDTVISIGGHDYLQFVCWCKTDYINLSTVNVTNPSKQKWTYYYYSDTTDYLTFSKGESFTFPEDFQKETGIWSFNFIGKKTKDSISFNSTVNDTIPD